jgi:plastocyanin
MRMMSLAATALLLGIQFIPGPRQPGTVAGRVEIKAPPPERVAPRYPSAAGQGSQSMPAIPTVVFLEGPVTGALPWAQPPRTAVVQKNLQFSPSLLMIPKDTSVSFPNEDGEFHNVFSYSKAKRFDLGRYRKGESKSVLFDKPGIIKVYCEIHPWMRAAILVLENPYYAVAAADGTFSITGIPAGHYELVVWNIDVGSTRADVDVTPGKTPDLRIRLQAGSDADVRERRLSLGDMEARQPQAQDSVLERACCAGKR